MLLLVSVGLMKPNDKPVPSQVRGTGAAKGGGFAADGDLTLGIAGRRCIVVA